MVLANPNAPTGITLQTGEIQRILAADPERVVIVDEAYADFSDDNCLRLIGSCPNLLIVRTFSKSWSLAGARLGCAIGNKDLIADLNRVKNAINPYNVNRMTAAAGIAAMDDKAYHDRCCQEICGQRERTSEALKKLGFTVLPSGTNFLFAKSADICGRDLYSKLKQRGILVRHFAQEGISDFVRITIGTAEDMDRLLEAIECIEQEAKDA